MELRVEPSKTESIAASLREDIMRGKIPEGAKLDGIRELARRFGVSLRIVSLALNRLQRDGLVVCEQGRGVFVRDWRSASVKDVFLLLWAKHDNANCFLRGLMDMGCPPCLRKGFRFNIRCVFDERLDLKLLARELAAVEAMGELRCLLVNSIFIDEKSLPLFQRLRVPTVFLGDFRDVALRDSKLDIVAGDNVAMARSCVDFFHSKGFGELLLLTPEPEKISFYKDFFESAQGRARELGMTIDFHALPDADRYPNGHVALEDVEAVVRKIGERRVASTPALLVGLLPQEPALFTKALRPEGSPPWVMPDGGSGNMNAFHKAVFDRLEAVLAGDGSPRSTRVVSSFALTDINSGRRWLWSEGSGEWSSQ